jgi:hypothetical protein
VCIGRYIKFVFGHVSVVGGGGGEKVVDISIGHVDPWNHGRRQPRFDIYRVRCGIMSSEESVDIGVGHGGPRDHVSIQVQSGVERGQSGAVTVWKQSVVIVVGVGGNVHVRTHRVVVVVVVVIGAIGVAEVINAVAE